MNPTFAALAATLAIAPAVHAADITLSCQFPNNNEPLVIVITGTTAHTESTVNPRRSYQVKETPTMFYLRMDNLPPPLTYLDTSIDRTTGEIVVSGYNEEGPRQGTFTSRGLCVAAKF
jgi:hypothetical protein